MTEFILDGKPVPFLPGQTIGAALMSAGVTSWRTTRVEEMPRGMFCGIGICFDCLITVNGVPDQRACLTLAEEGADVQRS